MHKLPNHRVLIAAVAVALALPVTASATIQRVTGRFSPTGKILSSGQQVKVGGRLQCTAGERIFVRVTVTQGGGALAQKNWGHHTCTGAPQHFGVTAAIQGPPAFEPRKARACALARTSNGSGPTDAWQWCSGITLKR